MQKKIGKVTINKNLENQNDAPPGQFITDKFPVFSAFPSPKIDIEQWVLSIKQENELLYDFNWEEINSMQTSIIKEDFHCVTQWSRLQTTWKGYLTSEMLKDIKINSELTYVTISCYDGYTTNILKSDLMSEKTILAKEYENENLKEEHGFPLRLVVPHLYGWKSAKWIKEIQFTNHATPGFWEVRGYHMNGNPWKQERFS